MVLYDKIPLKNGLILELWDDSREGALGFWTVVAIARCKIEVKDEYFKEFGSPLDWYSPFVKKVGHYLVYQQRKQRRMIPLKEKKNVFETMTERLKRHIIPYISKESFPKNFVLEKFRQTFLRSPDLLS